MSSVFKKLSNSDFLNVPYVARKSQDLTNCEAIDAGFSIRKGENVQQTETGSLTQQALTYHSVRKLFYEGYISGSISTASYYPNTGPSTAASGTVDYFISTFPTESGAEIKVLSVPSTVYGEALTPKTVKFYSNDSENYFIVDDGNGNLYDIKSGLDSQFGAGTYTFDSITDSFLYNTTFLSAYKQVSGSIGNVFYSQGVIVITSGSYLCLFDAGPVPHDFTVTFLTTDSPKTFNPFVSTSIDCASIDTGSISLIPISGYDFPDYLFSSGEITLDPSDPLSSTQGLYKIRYGVTSSVCTPSIDTAVITV